MSETSSDNLSSLSEHCTICDPKKKYFNCICDKHWNTFEEHLKKLQTSNSSLVEKELSISTMTLCCNFNSHIDLDTLADIYVDSVKYSPSAKKTKSGGNNECFYNSLLMSVSTKYQQPNKNGSIKVSIKFFPNGKLQIAGCKSIKSCCYAVRKAFNRVHKSGCFMENAYISHCKLVMINSDFKINKCINQEELTNILSTKTIDKNQNFLQVVYQSSKYPGINAKFVPTNKIVDYAKFQLKNGFKQKYPSVISLLIFRPGSIIITGGNNIEDYIDAQNVLLDIIKCNNNILKY
jgi:TATA-box binding protein (TBP) (component of TFIID and TFIIIB)